MRHNLLLFVTLTLLVTFAATLPGLNATTMWVDEGWSHYATNGPTPLDVTQIVAEDVHPPLYFYALYLWRGVTGESLFAMRYLSVLVMLAGTALVYRLGTDAFSWRVGLLAALLFGLHDLAGVLAQEVRQYPLLQTLTVLAAWLYWRFWTQPTSRRGLAFTLAGASLLWTGYWGGFFLLALAIHALVNRYDRLRPYVIAFATMGLLFLPWLPALLDQITGDVSGGIGHALPANSTGYAVLSFQLLGRPEWLWVLLALLGLLLMTPRRPAPAWIPALLVVVPVALSIAINLRFPSLSFRTLSPVIPFVLLLVAGAVTWFAARLRLPGGFALLSAALIALSIALPSAGPPIRLPWPEIAAYISHTSDESDALLVETWFDTYALAYYLPDDVTLIPAEIERRRRDPDEFRTILRNALVERDGLWVVRFAAVIDITPELYNAGFVQTATFDWETPLAPVKIRRYDHPITDGEPVATFGDTLALLAWDGVRAGNTLTVRLWWTAERQPEHEYIVSVFMLDANSTLITQHDSPPLDGRASTLTWQPDSIYFDAHTLDLPAYDGETTLGLRVYRFTDATFTVTETLPCGPDCDFVVLQAQ